MACYGIGMIVGALLAPKIIKLIPFGTAILVGPWFSVAASAVMLSTLFIPSGWLAGFSYFFIASQWGEATCLAVSLAAFIVQSLVITFSAVRGLKALPQN